MLFYWIILAIKKIVWFFRIPKPEDLARIDPNARCPSCGAREGKLRCVLKRKPGPTAKTATNPLISAQILCQHTCLVDGARWFDKPIASDVDPSKVLPSVARDDLEVAEDRQAKLWAEETPPSA
jgi:hypothetical protein